MAMDGSYGELKATVEEGANNNCAAATHTAMERGLMACVGRTDFSDRCTEVRELAGERWLIFQSRRQRSRLARRATPAQAFYIVGSFST